jgi:hypothetical protein
LFIGINGGDYACCCCAKEGKKDTLYAMYDSEAMDVTNIT